MKPCHLDLGIGIRDPRWVGWRLDDAEYDKHTECQEKTYQDTGVGGIPGMSRPGKSIGDGAGTERLPRGKSAEKGTTPSDRSGARPATNPIPG